MTKKKNKYSTTRAMLVYNTKIIHKRQFSDKNETLLIQKHKPVTTRILKLLHTMYNSYQTLLQCYNCRIHNSATAYLQQLSTYLSTPPSLMPETFFCLAPMKPLFYTGKSLFSDGIATNPYWSKNKFLFLTYLFNKIKFFQLQTLVLY